MSESPEPMAHGEVHREASMEPEGTTLQADRPTVVNRPNQLLDRVALAFALAITALASAFIGYKNGRIDLRFADAISDNNFLQGPFIPGDINIQNNHTHLLKWPVMLLENWVGFDVTTHRVTSIVLLLAMNLWLGWLFYVFSKKNVFATAVCLLLLSSVEIMTGLSANEGTLTMLTNRNIEVPMTVAILIFALRQRRFLTLASFLVTLLLSIIFVTDRLLLYTTVIGAAFFAIYLAVTSRNYDVRRLDHRPLFLTVVVAAVASEVIIWLFNVLGIAVFFARRDYALVFQGSFRDFFNYTLDNIGRIFAVFGADYFGQKVYYAPFFLVNVIALAITVWLGVRFIKKVRASGLEDDRDRVVFLLILMYFLAMLIFTVVIPRELGGRYFVFLPIIGLLLLARALEGVRIPSRTRATLAVLASAVVCAVFFAGQAIAADRVFYQTKLAGYTAQFGDTNRVAELLVENGVEAYMDSSYYRFELVKLDYDRITGGKLATVWLQCGSNEAVRHFGRRSWAQPSGKKVAIRVLDCDPAQTAEIFGEPNKIIDLPGDAKDQLFIYNTDVRSKLDLADFDRLVS